jgi:hypothetical protein
MKHHGIRYLLDNSDEVKKCRKLFKDNDIPSVSGGKRFWVKVQSRYGLKCDKLIDELKEATQ